MSAIATEWGPSLLHWLHPDPLPRLQPACSGVGRPLSPGPGDAGQPAEGRTHSQTPHNDLVTHTCLCGRKTLLGDRTMGKF